MSWVKRLHLITTALILKKKKDEGNTQPKEKKKKEIHSQQERKRNEDESFPEEAIPQLSLKEGVHVKQAKPSQQEGTSWQKTLVQQSRDHGTSKSGGSLRVTEICLPIKSQEINYTIHLCPYSPSGSKSTFTQGSLQEQRSGMPAGQASKQDGTSEKLSLASPSTQHAGLVRVTCS